MLPVCRLSVRTPTGGGPELLRGVRWPSGLPGMARAGGRLARGPGSLQGSKAVACVSPPQGFQAGRD